MIRSETLRFFTPQVWRQKTKPLTVLFWLDKEEEQLDARRRLKIDAPLPSFRQLGSRLSSSRLGSWQPECKQDTWHGLKGVPFWGLRQVPRSPWTENWLLKVAQLYRLQHMPCKRQSLWEEHAVLFWHHAVILLSSVPLGQLGIWKQQKFHNPPDLAENLLLSTAVGLGGKLNNCWDLNGNLWIKRTHIFPQGIALESSEMIFVFDNHYTLCLSSFKVQGRVEGMTSLGTVFEVLWMSPIRQQHSSMQS